MKRAALLLLFILTAAAPPSGQTAEQFVRAIYASFNASPDDGALGSHRARFFSEGMLRLLKRDEAAIEAEGGGVGVIDADPVCDCQDDTGLRLTKLTVTQSDAAHAFAKVELGYKDGGHVLLKLVREKRGWRIDDVKDDDQPWMSRLLKDEIRGAPSGPAQRKTRFPKQ